MTSEQRQAQLKALRDRLDMVDADLVALAAERQRIVSEIGQVKQGDGRQVRDFRREREVLEHVRRRAKQMDLDPDLAEDLLKRLIEASLTRQEQERGRLAARGDGRRALVIGGGGLMGRWVAGFLDNQGFAVAVADPSPATGDQDWYSDWSEAPLDVEVIVVAAPIQISAGIIDDLAQRGTDALVFDIGSIKTPLMQPLRQAAAAGLTICSVHPMFGPDTRLLSGRHVLLMDVGCPRAVEQAAALFADTMADVLPIELEQHDRLIALVLGLSHAVNIAFFTALAESGISADQLAGISSTTFSRQLAITRDVAAENPDLYFEIQQLNRHGNVARDALLDAVTQLNQLIDGNNAEGFRQLMLTGRQYLESLQDASPKPQG
jgi:chorismate mutase / prephenate dehydrogenase